MPDSRLVVATHYGSGMTNIQTIIKSLDGNLIDVASYHQATTLRFDRLLLLGGSDIDPAFYGEGMRGSHGTDVTRDNIEWSLVRRALSQRIPVMGICRGHQMLAVAAGGSLYQDIGWDHGMQDHEIIDVHPRLAAHLPNAPVNSYHHQAIKRMPYGFSIAAKSKDGIIEAIFRTGILGVQFHPEFLISDDKRLWKLFAWFMAGLDQRESPQPERFRRPDKHDLMALPANVPAPTAADLADAKPTTKKPAESHTEKAMRKATKDAYDWKESQPRNGLRLRDRLSGPAYGDGYHETYRTATGHYHVTGKTADSWQERDRDLWGDYPATTGTGWKKSPWPAEDGDGTKLPKVTAPKQLGAIDQTRAVPSALPDEGDEPLTDAELAEIRAEIAAPPSNDLAISAQDRALLDDAERMDDAQALDDYLAEHAYTAPRD